MTNKFQQSAISAHPAQKERLIGRGGNSNVPPFSTKPSFERSKSAPPNAGVLENNKKVQTKMIKVKMSKLATEDKLFKPKTPEEKSQSMENDKRIAFDSGVDADGVIDPKVAKDEMGGNDLEEMSGMGGGGISGAVAKPLKKEDKLPGGIADDAKDSQFDSKQLEMGIAHESEHTDDPEKAKEIAKDHLSEDPNYYTKLNESFRYARKLKRA